MVPKIEDNWSDSDDENDDLSGVETSILLGIPDGPITSSSDIEDAAVSRIGGRPAFLPSREPLLSTSQCKHCSNLMELLVQMWCPFEDSPMDRALYIWGCARGSCRGKAGSIRVWRGLRRNEAYAAKLERKRSRKRVPIEARSEVETVKKSNPFATSGSSTHSPVGLGSHIFGDALVDDNVTVDAHSSSDNESEVSTSSDSASVIVAMSAVTLDLSPWLSAPSYPPLYLSTLSEYIPRQQQTKQPLAGQLEERDGGDSNDTKANWVGFESYEHSLDVDHVFERFMRRVAFEGQQCVRYELGGVPLPFASDEVFESMFPKPIPAVLPVTKPDFKVVATPKRVYTPTSIPPCPICNSTRVFECQLMPNLINVLSPSDGNYKTMTDEERRRELARELRTSDKNKNNGMEWGTCIVFSCKNDCCIDEEKGEGKECWREEVVLIQWDK